MFIVSLSGVFKAFKKVSHGDIEHINLQSNKK